MGFFDDFTAGAARLSKAQKERKRDRDARIRVALEKRENWTRDQFEEEEARLAEEIENWPHYRAAA